MFKALTFAWKSNVKKCFIILKYILSCFPFTPLLQISSYSMASSMMDGVGKAVVGVWRAHTVLDESDGAESSPEAPDRFRKLRSSSSLNSLRMSLRKRLPLRSVQANSLPENPTWETQKEQPKPNAVRKLTRSARNSITGVYHVGGLVWVYICVLICSLLIIFLLTCVLLSLTQRMQRNREFARGECLVETPGRMCDGEASPAPASSSSRTPRRTPGRAATPRRTPRATPGRTPGSRGRKTPEAGVRGVKTGGGRRQLVRMAALRSPFASPNTQNQRLWVFCYSDHAFKIVCSVCCFNSCGFPALSVCFSAVTESLNKIWILCPVGSGGSNTCPGRLMT